MGFNIIEGYGLSETTGPIAIPYYKTSMAGSVGTPIKGNEVLIKNINEDGIGEIWFKGDAVMPGYYKNDEANSLAFDENGFFNTGDLGRLDRKGNIYITGRMKNVIVLDSGKKVYPEEIESYFKQSTVISEIAVFERKVSGRATVFAVMVPSVKSGKSFGMIRSVVESLNNDLPDYKRVRGFAVSMDELPKNSTKKILYNEINSLLEQGVYQTDESDSPQLRDIFRPSNSREEQAASLIKDYFRVKSLMANQSLDDFNMDSLGLIEFIVYLEKEMRIEINPEEFRRKQTVSELVIYISSLEETADKSVEKWILEGEYSFRPYPFFNPLHHLAIGFLGGMSRLFWGIKAVNAHKLVLDNKIVVANHQSYLDMVWISYFVPWKYRKNVYATAKKRLSFLRFVFPMFPVIFLDDTNSIEVLKGGADILRQGKTLIIFPEGTRSQDGNIQSFRSGAAFLAKNLNIKIIPVSVKGGFEIWPRDKSLPHFITSFKGKILVGDEIDPANYKSVESLNLALQETVSNMQESM
jgi:long-chain acyl-CoA synthetase